MEQMDFFHGGLIVYEGVKEVTVAASRLVGRFDFFAQRLAPPGY
jgi:hypothetical protein